MIVSVVDQQITEGFPQRTEPQYYPRNTRQDPWHTFPRETVPTEWWPEHSLGVFILGYMTWFVCHQQVRGNPNEASVVAHVNRLDWQKGLSNNYTRHMLYIYIIINNVWHKSQIDQLSDWTPPELRQQVPVQPSDQTSETLWLVITHTGGGAIRVSFRSNPTTYRHVQMSLCTLAILPDLRTPESQNLLALLLNHVQPTAAYDPACWRVWTCTAPVQGGATQTIGIMATNGLVRKWTTVPSTSLCFPSCLPALCIAAVPFGSGLLFVIYLRFVICLLSMTPGTWSIIKTLVRIVSDLLMAHKTVRCLSCIHVWIHYGKCLGPHSVGTTSPEVSWSWFLCVWVNIQVWLMIILLLHVHT